MQYYTNSRTKQQMPLYYQLYRDYKDHGERLDIIKAARSINVPFLICHGSEDNSVPVEQAYRLHQANPRSRLLIVPSDHVFGRKHPWTEQTLPTVMQELIRANISFFQKALL